MALLTLEMVALDITTINVQSNITTVPELLPLNGSASWESGSPAWCGDRGSATAGTPWCTAAGLRSRASSRTSPGRAPGLRRCIPAGMMIEYRKKSLLGACPVAAVHHGCRAQVVVLYSIPVPTGVHRRSQGAQPVHGDRGMVPRTQCPEAALLCIQSTRNPQGAQWFSLSLSLSLSRSP